MRKWHWIGTLAIAIGCYAGYRHFTTPAPEIDQEVRTVTQTDTTRQIPAAKHDGDAEPSDTIEPLVVDRGSQADFTVRGDFGAQLEIVPRVMLTPGMKQPPRPDVVSGANRRMPFADE